jgi:LysR family transcriptional regulator, nitrogen assimilation regulatory protein
MISLRQIRYFVAVAKSGSFSAAAQIAHVSQPSLCVQMKQLEQEIGAKLLSRHARGVELTAAGTAFLPHATAALKEIKRAEEAVAALNASHVAEISLGVTPTSGRALVADLLRKCKESARTPKLLFREGLSDELWKLVADGELDASFCYDPSEAPTMRIVPLYREDLFLVGPRNILAAADAVDRAALGNFPLVLGYRGHRTRHFIEAAARAAGADLRTVEEIEPRTLKRELLVRHGRCSIVPYGLFLDEIKSGELAARLIKPRLTRTVALLFNTSVPATAQQFLLAAVRSIVKLRIGERELGWRAV